MTQMRLASPKHYFADPYEAMDYYTERGWTDGLPIIPPTEERVARFLAAAGLAPDQVVAEYAVRRRIVRAEKVAINAVMAGCKPAYMPVVVAALQAMCAHPFHLHGPAASLAGPAPLLIVSGPAAKRLGFNAGGNVLGQGPRANATVGRAIRLILINLFGAVPGVLDKSTFGHPGKYSYCIAESEELGSWLPLHVERGYAPEDSAVTVFAGQAPIQVPGGGTNPTPENILHPLARVILGLAGPSYGHWVVIIGPESHSFLERAGWSKADVRQFLFENTYRTVADCKRAGMDLGTMAEDYDAVAEPAEVVPSDEEREARPFRRPDDLLVVLAGGGAGGMNILIPPWFRLSEPVTRKFEL